MFKGPVPTRKLKAKRSTSHTRYSSQPKKPSSRKKKSKRKLKISAAPPIAAKSKIKVDKPAPEFFVGEITHYFQKISVVVVHVVEHPILIGDLIHIKGKGVDFTQKVESLQVESKDVRFARKGELVGLQVVKPAKLGDKIYKIKK